METTGSDQIQINTYQSKENHSYRVIIRNVHYSIDIEELKKLYIIK